MLVWKRHSLKEAKVVTVDAEAVKREALRHVDELRGTLDDLEETLAELEGVDGEGPNDGR